MAQEIPVSQRLPEAATAWVQRPSVVICAIGACLALVLGLSIGIGEPTNPVAVLLGLGLLFLALVHPFAVLALFWALLPLVPLDGYMFGLFIPNLYQLFCPALLIGTAAASLSRRLRHAIQPSSVDVGILLFTSAGYVGIVVSGHGEVYKHYTNAIVFPMLFYFVVRLIPLDHRRLGRLMACQLVSVSICAVLLLWEAQRGVSSLYQIRYEQIQGLHAPCGPFPAHWTSAAFMAVWPPVFLYAASRGRHNALRGFCAVGCLLAVLTCLRTLERAQILGAALGLLICLAHPRLRTAGRPFMLSALLAGILGMGFLEAALLPRFRDPEMKPVRAGYREQAAIIIASEGWNPLLGTGFYGASWVTGEREGQHLAIHNLPLQLVTEFGILGTALSVGIIGCSFWAAVRLLHQRRRGVRVNTALLTAILGVAASLGAISYYHNAYAMSQVTVLMWALLGMLTGHPSLFLEHQDPPSGTGELRRAAVPGLRRRTFSKP
jgi:hypothetical protein